MEKAKRVEVVRAVIQNVRPRVDVRGEVIDCHDGCVRFFGGRFYWYGTRYGETDGFTEANEYVVYSSVDLVNWEGHGALIRGAARGVYYRPYVVWNARTGLYVLWYNWYPKLWDGQFGCAVSEDPRGPFRVVNEKVRLRGSRPGDHNLFVDEDGVGYVVYTDIGGLRRDGEGANLSWDEYRHAMSVERLTEDFTGSTLEGSEVIDRRVEAPAMFKRGGRYYLLFGETCCFCTEGADARVYVAEGPLGPYRKIGDINRDEGGGIIVKGQQTDVCVVPTEGGEAYLWMADLWGSRKDGVKGHDVQFWSEPMEFGEDGSIGRLRWVDEFELRVRV